MATTSSNNRVETVCRMIPLLTSEPSEALLALLEAASRAALEYHDLTPIGEPAIAVRGIDDWVRQVWADDGHDLALLGNQVLLMAFACVPKDSIN
jgi:hypothetical protein